MYTAQQLVTYALQIVKAPGYTQQAGDMLNARLAQLAQNYDLQVLMRSTVINMVSGTQQYTLPADYVRGQQVLYYIGGLPQTLNAIDLSNYTALNSGTVLQAYPTLWTSDPSQTPPLLYVYPMPSLSTPLTVRYFYKPTDIVNPATSSTVPWFPDGTYLLTALAADLMGITDDTRQAEWLDRANNMLRDFLKMQGDQDNYAKTVKLSPSFRGGRALPPSKLTGY